MCGSQPRITKQTHFSFLIPNYSLQDTTFLEFIYFYRRSTRFRRFLRPSSGAHKCTYSFKYWNTAEIWKSVNSAADFWWSPLSAIAPSSSKQYWPIVTWWPTARCTFSLRLPFRYHDVPGFTLTANVCDGTRRHLIMIWRSDILPTELRNTLAMQHIRSQWHCSWHWLTL